MNSFRFVLTAASLTLLNAGAALNYSPVLAQAQGKNDNILKNQALLIVAQKCGNTEAVKPSKTTKTVTFPKFGIKVKIPSNYKTMPRKDGSISILDPGSYEAIRCQAPHGLYSFNIKVLSNPKNLSLEQFARVSYNQQPLRINNYNQNNIKALLLDSEGGYGAYGIFKAPGVKGVVEMSASCDCEVDRSDVARYLKVTEFIR